MPSAIRDLASAVNQRATEIFEGDDPRGWADAKDLARALARILCGESLHSAFGAPGDWGYDTPIGKALAAVYSKPVAEKIGAPVTEFFKGMRPEIYLHGAKLRRDKKTQKRLWGLTLIVTLGIDQALACGDQIEAAMPTS